MDAGGIYAGLDVTGGGKRLTLALLSAGMHVDVVHAVSRAEVAEMLAAAPEAVVAVGGPLHRSGHRFAAEETGFGLPSRRDRLERARAAEADLARRGIPLRLTPAVEGTAPGWMRDTFQLGRELTGRGFVEGAGGHESRHWLIETHPMACFTVLLGRIPLGRETLEGRLQRQLILIRKRIDLADPLDALEEITAHHLLAGRLNLDGVQRPDELDAIAAAFTAWQARSIPAEVNWIGGEGDGWMCLPAGGLSENYRRQADG